MKKILILPALFALVATGCGEDEQPSSVEWSQEIKAEMTEYLGLVLPYVQFDEATLYHEWSEEESGYFIGDDSETNVLDGYGDRLIRTGWTAVTQEGYVNYTKSTEAGELTLHAQWYEATEEYPCGNEIAIYVDGGGVVPPGDDPVTGTYTFTMSEMGWSDQDENPSVVADPGLSIAAGPGKNTQATGIPKYFSSGASIRLYALNTLTLAADEITKIEFTFTLVKDNQTMTASVGNISSFTNESATWEGSASQVIFTLGSKGQIRISEMKVTGTFSGGGSPIVPGGDERTVEDIAKDICSALEMSTSDIEWDGQDAYISVIFDGVSNLEEACLAGIDYLPDYVEEDGDPEAGQWADGDEGYFAYYVDAESLIYIDIGSYLSGNEYVTQYCIYQMVY